jgi:hypothetical protein
VTTLTLSDKLLTVLIAVQRKKQFAFSEHELGLIESIDIDKSVRKFFYSLPQELTTELSLKRNERCIRAIEIFQIPDVWLETELNELNKFSFFY